jgi:hypothetical protein
MGRPSRARRPAIETSRPEIPWRRFAIDAIDAERLNFGMRRRVRI